MIELSEVLAKEYEQIYSRFYLKNGFRPKCFTGVQEDNFQFSFNPSYLQNLNHSEIRDFYIYLCKNVPLKGFAYATPVQSHATLESDEITGEEGIAIYAGTKNSFVEIYLKTQKHYINSPNKTEDYTKQANLIYHVIDTGYLIPYPDEYWNPYKELFTSDLHQQNNFDYYKNIWASLRPIIDWRLR